MNPFVKAFGFGSLEQLAKGLQSSGQAHCACCPNASMACIRTMLDAVAYEGFLKYPPSRFLIFLFHDDNNPRKQVRAARTGAVLGNIRSVK